MTSDDLSGHNCKNSKSKKWHAPSSVEKLTVLVFLALNNINLTEKKKPTQQDRDK